MVHSATPTCAAAPARISPPQRSAQDSAELAALLDRDSVGQFWAAVVIPVLTQHYAMLRRNLLTPQGSALTRSMPCG